MESPKNEPSGPAESEHSWSWIVEDYSKHLQASVGTKIASPPFSIGNYTLEFWWYPRGTDKENQNYVGLFLKLTGPEESLITYSLHLGYADTSLVFKTTKCREFFEPVDDELSHGSARLEKCQKLLEKVAMLKSFYRAFSSYLPGKSMRDELVIKCIIYGLDVPETQNRLQILDNYENFVDSKKLSDVKIIVGDKTILAHKIILINASEVFAAMFEHDMLENQEGVVNINDIDYDVMLRIVRYMYTGKIERIFQNTKELLIAADKYSLEKLKSMCAKYLCTTDLSPSNAFDRINFAHTYNVGELKEAAESFSVNRAKEISQLPNLEELLAGTDARLIVKFIKSLSKVPE